MELGTIMRAYEKAVQERDTLTQLAGREDLSVTINVSCSSASMRLEMFEGEGITAMTTHLSLLQNRIDDLGRQIKEAIDKQGAQ